VAEEAVYLWREVDVGLSDVLVVEYGDVVQSHWNEYKLNGTAG
jgi:hypothetical protein